MAYINDLRLKFPLDYIAFTRGFTSSHFGADLGWNSNHGGQNVPVYAPADGTIYAIQEGRNNDVPNGGWGNCVKINHGNGVYTLSANLLKGSINALGVKVGQVVRRGQQIGKMNNSGNSKGSHVHFEVYYGGAGTGYRVDPLKYCYAYPDQKVSTGSVLLDKIMYYNPTPTGQIGTPVERNTSVNQVEVVISDLRARKRPETNDDVILGYIKGGVYNVVATRDMTHEASNGHFWYEVEPGVWIAKGDAWNRYYPADEGSAPDSPDKNELTAIIAKYANLVGDIQTLIKNFNPEV